MSQCQVNLDSVNLSIPLLSIVLPAYNEADRLPQTLEKIDQFLKTQPYVAEVVVVENGSQDNTLEIAQSYAERFPNLRVIHEERAGKGLAVRTGMLQATGQYRFICDVDLSMPIKEVNRFIPPSLEDVPIAIASREADGAERIGEPEYRHIVGRVFNALVRLMALPGLHDSQCGFKCFRADVAEELFACQTIDGWTFDVEVLFVARRRGYKIIEVPISWYYNADSKVRVVRDSFFMASDLLQIRLNALRGRYADCGKL
jgi:glycosyltransferase involved in cell wall biosynthesis